MHTVALMNNGRLSWRPSRLCGWRWCIFDAYRGADE